MNRHHNLIVAAQMPFSENFHLSTHHSVLKIINSSKSTMVISLTTYPWFCLQMPIKFPLMLPKRNSIKLLLGVHCSRLIGAYPRVYPLCPFALLAWPYQSYCICKCKALINNYSFQVNNATPGFSFYITFYHNNNNVNNV